MATQNGTEGDDTLTGGGDGDTLNGFGGSDDLGGLAGNDILDGGAGADLMTGGAGDDDYVVDDKDDVTREAAGGGADGVTSSADAYCLRDEIEELLLAGAAVLGVGNASANTITGTAGLNRLNGRGGTDTLRGGAGDDIYVVRSAAADDQIVELAGQGSDTIRTTITNYVLPAEVENIRLDGVADIDAKGNAGGNSLFGNEGDNLLDGGAGADRMGGREGDDRYLVDHADDRVLEGENGGVDRVTSSVDYNLTENVEEVTLAGTAIRAVGNDLANRLTGTAGNNVLDGRGGNDIMAGGAGNDIYFVDQAGDQITETGGVDRVISTVTFVVPSGIENLTLAGSATIDGTGDAAANTILGNVAANVLKGLAGADRLVGRDGDDDLHGGAGKDELLGGRGRDDFFFDDTIRLDRDIFAAITSNGVLSAAAFHTGATAQAADDRILFDIATGQIFYDADGSGSGAAILFATVDAGIMLSHLDFVAYT